MSAAKTGASVSMTAHEAHQLAGNGPVRLVTCENGRVIGGVGEVGLVEHAGNTDIVAFMEEVKKRRADLAERASKPKSANPREDLFEFVKI